jgi:AcrR family transcriptional regulator
MAHLATEGFSSMSIRKISAAVGITAAGIYSHFDSKEAILGAGLARAYAEFLRFIFRVEGSSAEIDIDLPTIAERHMRFQIDRRVVAESSDRLLSELLLENLLEAHTVTIFRTAQRFYSARVRAEVARYRGPTALDASVEAEAILTLCDSVKGGPRSKPSLDADQLISDYLIVIDRILMRDESSS